MPTEINEILYQDFDIKFTPNPYSGDVPLLKNEKAIIRAVRNLVLTNIFDHFYNPGIYSGVLSALFENFDPILVIQLQNAIQQVITNYEPRVNFLSCIVSSDQAIDNNAIDIKIYVRPIIAKAPITIGMTLQRIR